MDIVIIPLSICLVSIIVTWGFLSPVMSLQNASLDLKYSYVDTEYYFYCIILGNGLAILLRRKMERFLGYINKFKFAIVLYGVCLVLMSYDSVFYYLRYVLFLFVGGCLSAIYESALVLVLAKNLEPRNIY